jgi:UDP-glucose 4-epimerase
MARDLHVVVTGATGNLGSQVVPALLSDSDVDRVTGLARRPPDPEKWADGVTYRAVDLGQPGSAAELRAVFADADVVVHLAWRIQPSHNVGDMRRVNVDGTKRVAEAVADTSVGALVVVSSLGAYGPGPKDRAVDESFPTTGIRTSAYSRQKAEMESWFDEYEVAHPGVRLVRLRPALVLQGQAGSELSRYFLGPLAPVSIVRPGHLPIVPKLPRMRFQIVHTADVADAVVRAATSEVEGAFNLATEPVLDAETIADTIHATVVPVPLRLVRSAMTVGWNARVFPTDAGWLDMGLGTPIMDTSRARDVLGWKPERDSRSVLLEFMAGVADRRGGVAPVLQPLASAPLRLLDAGRRLLTGGIGSDSPARNHPH